MTGIGSVWDIGHFGSVIRPEEINLIPFRSKGAFTYVLNVLMFLPLGFLLPLLWKDFRGFGKGLAAGENQGMAGLQFDLSSDVNHSLTVNDKAFLEQSKEIHKIAHIYKEADEAALNHISKIDKNRAAYYHYYTGQKFGDTKNDDICLNSSRKPVISI